MPAVFSRIKTWVSNEVLTASDLNAEINNLLNNTIPASIDDYSVDVSTMQTTADPGGVGTESLATTLAGEITRLRYKIKQLMNGAQWYSTPVGSLSTGGISTAAIANLGVTTAKIADANVTRAKLEAVGQQLSAQSGVASTSSSTYVDVTNLSVTITTTGRPVFLTLVPGSAGNASSIFVGISSGTPSSIIAYFAILRGASIVSEYNLSRSEAAGSALLQLYVPSGSILYLDTPPAGTYTYKMQYKAAANSTAGVNYASLIAYEL